MSFLRLLLTTLCATCYLAAPVAAAEVLPAPVVDAVIYTKTGEVPVTLELAATPETRETGLMKRDTIGPHDGMIFIFPKAEDHTFWMKNTRIPLDMLFVRENRTIAHIASNTVPHSLTGRHADEPVCAVIELDGGRASREGIAEGDHVRYDLPPTVEVR